MNQAGPLTSDAGFDAAEATPRSLSLLRGGILTVVLVAEILLLTLHFDTQRLSQESGAWAWLLAQSPQLLRAGIAMAVATLLFGGVRIGRDCQELARQLPPSCRWPLYVVAHFVVFLVFAWLTGRIFEGDLQSLGNPGRWSCLWVIWGLGTLGFLAAAILPPSLWFPLAQKAAPPILGGMLVGLAAWGFGALSGYLWLPLGQATFWTVNALLGLASSDLVCQPDMLVIGSSAFAVEIAPECSGYQGIGLISVFLTVYVWLFRAELRFPQVLVLFPLGAILIWLANALRIAALIGIGSAGWEEVARGGFHSQAGWLAFNGLALGFVAVTRKVRLFQTSVAADDSAADGPGQANPTVAYLAPLMAILAITMVIGALSSGFDWLYPLRVVAALAVLLRFRKVYGTCDWSLSWQAVALGAATFGLWLMLAPTEMFEGSGLPGELTEAGVGLTMVWLTCRLLGYVITVPIAEELAFRGYLTRRLLQRDFQHVALGRLTWLSVLVSSVLFGVMHGRCWLAGILAGMLFAVALHRRGRLSDAVTAHATANALIAVYVLTTGHWSMWS